MNHAALLKQLEVHEGYKRFPYRDSVGVETIGYGRNLDDVGIDRSEAIFLLENDIEKAIASLKYYSWFPHLSGVRKRVVVDMVFNLGVLGFSKFRKTIKHIKTGHFKKAAKEMLDSKWAKQVGARAVRLARMMETNTDEVFLK